MGRSAEAAQQWGIDPNRLAVIGFSAGAHLAAQAYGLPGVCALVLVYPALEDAGDVPTAQAVEDLAARNIHCENALARACVPSDGAHVYVVASTNDRLLPPASHADPLVARLRELGVLVTYQRAKLGAHGFGVRKKWTYPCSQFLAEACSRRVAVVTDNADDCVAELMLQLNVCGKAGD